MRDDQRSRLRLQRDFCVPLSGSKTRLKSDGLDLRHQGSNVHPTETLIRKLRSDTHLSDEDAAEIRALPVHVRHLPADTPIVREGDRPNLCCLIVKGFTARSKVIDTGRRQILAFHIPGDIPDLQSLFLKTIDHDLVTISDATLAFIDHADLSRLIDSRPALARALWRETLIDAAVFREWIVNMGVRDAASRLAHLMAELRQRLLAVGLVADEEFQFPVTQAELADALGLSTVHVNRVLQAFRAQGVLDIRKNLVTLVDVEKVIAVSGFDSTYLHQTSTALHHEA
jgi:CRP-like cAMP-binding protein